MTGTVIRTVLQELPLGLYCDYFSADCVVSVLRETTSMLYNYFSLAEK